MKNTKKYTNKIKLIAVLILITITGFVNSQTPVGTGFSYQGELLDNGAAANGNYDIILEPYTVVAGGSAIPLTFNTFTDVPVVNGLFSIQNVDFGDFIYLQSQAIWIQVSVRKSASGNNYTDLNPRQRIQAIPYAVQTEFANEAKLATTATTANTASNLTISGANSGDVLAYNGVNWGSANSLHVNSNGGSSIGADDVPPSNGLKVRGNTHIGPNVSSTNVSLDVNSTLSGVQDDPLRIRKNGTIKFYVDSNGGTSVGSWNTPPINGLKVSGDTVLDGQAQLNGNIISDVKQDFNNFGIIKYMATVNCQASNSNILRYKNLVNNDEITASDAGGSGRCYLHFPHDVSSRYWQVSSLYDDTIATCRYIGSSPSDSRLRCETRGSDGGYIEGRFMIFVY